VVGLAGAALLVVGTVATAIHITVVTVTKATFSGWHFLGPALVLIALFAVPMLVGALRGSRPAAAAVGGLGLVALVLVLAVVQPKIHDTGVYGQDYDQAAAGPSVGYYAETLGAVLLLVSGVGLLLLSGGARRRRRDEDSLPAPAGPAARVADPDAAPGD
jgi:uncharacterized membrane protein